MTNEQHLRQDGSNCPFDGDSNCKAVKHSADGCSIICREQIIERLNKTAKGRRWLADEAKDSDL